MNYLTLLKGVNLPRFDEDYKKLVLDRRHIWENINQISESEVKDTIIEFLKRWKIRNVKRIVPTQLKEVLKELSKHFHELRNSSLIDLDFNEKIDVDGQKKRVSEIIKEIYTQLTERVNGVGPTSASKIMHCIIPQLFMMWDEKIRNGYGYAGNAIGYLKFLRESQQILKSIIASYGRSPEDLCREASPTMNKTLTKLLDEYNHMKFTQKKDLPSPTEDC
ncbi:hypothetical protein HRbin01_00020 [archaeon HR01]|nr:hypothetical protein HRbin01_00020 [archaeon HR01]